MKRMQKPGFPKGTGPQCTREGILEILHTKQSQVTRITLLSIVFTVNFSHMKVYCEHALALSYLIHLGYLAGM